MRRTAKFPLALLSWIPLLAAFACSRVEPAWDGPRGPDVFYACELFPGKEAEAELRGLEIGQASGPLDASSGKKFARCAYGHGPQAIVVASLEIRRHESPAVLRRKAEASLPLLERLTKRPVEPIEGVGDVAWWAGGELRLLKVGWRDLELLVTVTPTVAPGQDPNWNRDTAERIARRAILRLEEKPIPEELRIAPIAVDLSGAPAGSG